MRLMLSWRTLRNAKGLWAGCKLAALRGLGLGLLLALLLGGAGGVGCGDKPLRPYNNNDLELITAYTAREVCACHFVSLRSKAECLSFTKASPAVATFRINEKNKSVSAGALTLWSARARYVSKRVGCQLDPR